MTNHHSTRRLTLGMLATGTLTGPLLARAQTGAVPGRPIWIITTSPAGSLMDMFARRLAPMFAEATGSVFQVEHAPGGGGLVAMRRLLAAGPERPSVLLSDTSLVTLPAFFPNLPYDPINDIRCVSPLFVAPVILAVRSGLGITDYRSFIERSLAAPGQMTYGSIGVRSGLHLGVELLTLASGARWTHVPFKGGAEVALELSAGRIDFALLSRNTSRPLIASGAVRPIAVTESVDWPETRKAAVLNKVHANYQYRSIWGIVAGTTMAPEFIERLNRATASSVRRLASDGQLEEWGVEALPAMTPGGFQALMTDEIGNWKRWAKAIDAS